MSQSDDTLIALSHSLALAKDTPQYASRPSASYELSVDDAYRVQAHQVDQRVQRGEKVAAIKLGLTDLAQQQRAGWFAPSFGTLTDQMMVPDGGSLSLSRGLRPRVEPEIVFVLAQDVSEPPASAEQARELIAQVHVGIEVVDPRFDDSEFILTDAIADNGSAHAGVISRSFKEGGDGSWADEELVLTIDGVDTLQGSGAAIMGNPLQVVTDVIKERLRLGLTIEAGLAIFSGNVAGKAVAVSPGQTVTVRSATLGEVTLQIEA